MIVDIHAHVFPYLGGASGYDSAATHLKHFQKQSQFPPQPVRRLADGGTVEDRTLWASWDDNDPTFKGAQDVNFRVGRFGRTEWTKNGVDYYVQLCAPSLMETASEPDYLLAEMDYAGIDVALLQNPYLYGQLDEYIADVVKKHPRRFVGQAQIYEPEAGSDDQIARFRRSVKELGLSAGVYFNNGRLSENAFRHQMDDNTFLPFWEEASSLGSPVFADIRAIPAPGSEGKSSYQLLLNQMLKIDALMTKFPNLVVVLVHGIPMRIFRTPEGLKPVPDEMWEIWKRPNLHIEVLFPIQASYPSMKPGENVWTLSGASQWDYPYREAHPLIREMYQRLGPEKMLWGSDIPFVLRNCTYRQSLDYLVRYCDFIRPQDMDLILGDNAARILKITPRSEVNVATTPAQPAVG